MIKIKKFKICKLSSKKKGFGLLEVLISGLIIIMILAALVMIARASMNNNQYMQKRAQALYLAQEGIENVRYNRDSNWIDGLPDTAWNSMSTTSAIPVAGGCYKVDMGTNTVALTGGYVTYRGLTHINTATSKDLCKNSSSAESIDEHPINPNYTDATKPNNKVDASAPSDSFQRTIWIIPAGASQIPAAGKTDVNPTGNALQVTAYVKFSWQGQNKMVEASEIITNWRPNF